jgi:hypothetical protein
MMPVVFSLSCGVRSGDPLDGKVVMTISNVHVISPSLRAHLVDTVETRGITRIEAARQLRLNQSYLSKLLIGKHNRVSEAVYTRLVTWSRYGSRA